MNDVSSSSSSYLWNIFLLLSVSFVCLIISDELRQLTILIFASGPNKEIKQYPAKRSIDMWILSTEIIFYVILVWKSNSLAFGETMDLVNWIRKLVLLEIIAYQVMVLCTPKKLLYSFKVLVLSVVFVIFNPYHFSIWLAISMARVNYGLGDTSNLFELGRTPQQLSNNKSLPSSRKKVCILTMGSRGDVQPFVALGVELQRKGNLDVVICTLGRYQELVERYNLAFVSMGIEHLGFNNDENRSVWRDKKHVSEVIASLQGGISRYYKHICSSSLKACANSDMIIATAVTCGIGLNISEYLGVPCWLVKLSPDIPTRAYAPNGARSVSLQVLNLLGWYRNWFKIFLASIGGRKLQQQPEAQFRQELGLVPLGGGRRVRQLLSTPTLCAFSSSIFPKPADYPINALVTGFWFVDEPTTQKQDSGGDRVTAFAGTSKPLCICFGSMTEVAVELGLLLAVCRAVKICNAIKPITVPKIIIVNPYHDFASDPEGATYRKESGVDVLLLDEVGHEKLFPVCSVVVHHGGAGTSARVLQFGIPSVIIPVMLWTDQPIWGHRLETLGVARVVERSSQELDSDIALRVQSMLDDPNAIKNAKAIGSKLEKENGLNVAVDALLKHIS